MTRSSQLQMLLIGNEDQMELTAIKSSYKPNSLILSPRGKGYSIKLYSSCKLKL